MKQIIILLLVLGIVILAKGFILPNKELTQKMVVVPTPVPTIPKTCSGQLTPNMTEGPYYKESSPDRGKIVDTQPGEKLILEGYVFDKNCAPVVHAWIDFWQADSRGVYDNGGFRLRGHQRTDSSGRYYLETIIPGEYSNRAPHIHVKVQATSKRPQLTTQLFFPNNIRNTKDELFNPQNLIQIKQFDDRTIGFFNFVIE